VPVILKIVIGIIIFFVVICVIGYIASLIFPNDSQTASPAGRPDQQEPKTYGKDEQVPIDISRMRIKTPDGVVERTITEKERKAMRKQMKGKNVIETRPAAKEKRETASKKDNLKWIDDIEAYNALMEDDDSY